MVDVNSIGLIFQYCSLNVICTDFPDIHANVLYLFFNLLKFFLFPILGHWWSRPQSPSRLLCICFLRQQPLIWRWLWKSSRRHLSPFLRVGASWLEEWPKLSTTQLSFFSLPSLPSSIILLTKTLEWTSWVRVIFVLTVFILLFLCTRYMLFHIKLSLNSLSNHFF